MGIVLSGVSAFGLYHILSKILGMTSLVMEKARTIAQETNAQPDTLMMQKWVMEELASADNQFITLAMIAIMLCWFVGVVDSYRIGLAVDRRLESER